MEDRGTGGAVLSEPGSREHGAAQEGTALPPAVLLGVSPGACRALRAAGVPTVVADERDLSGSKLAADSLARCAPYRPSELSDAWAESMAAIAEGLGPARPVLFATSDVGLLAIRRYHPSLSESYVVASPPPETVATLIDKVAFARWAEAHQVPAPPSCLIPVGQSLPAGGPGFSPPYIVKPSLTFELERSDGAKLFSARNAEELEERVARCHRQGLDVVVQEDLSRLQSLQWSLAGVCVEPGKLEVGVLARKLRQVPWGAGTSMETMPMDPRVWSVAERFCRAMRFEGIFEMELRPGSDGDPRVIEVNPRIWSQVVLPARAGVNLLHQAYLAALGRELPPSRPYRPFVGWMSWRRDWRVAMSLLRRGKLDVADWLRSLTRVRVLG